MHWKELKLKKGEPFITSEKGNSMEPRLSSGQSHELTPCVWMECKVNDIVFCKVHGRYYTHLVHAYDPIKGLHIGNNKGGLNGWTKQVFGRVTRIL
jgi:hypothetical protein